jgi:hypothetical protein
MPKEQPFFNPRGEKCGLELFLAGVQAFPRALIQSAQAIMTNRDQN